jgi:hypothetical protein
MGTEGHVTQQFKKKGGLWGDVWPTFHLSLVPKLENRTQPTWRNYTQLVGHITPITTYTYLSFHCLTLVAIKTLYLS